MTLTNLAIETDANQVFCYSNGNYNKAVGSISYPGFGDFFNYEGGLGSQITSFLVEAN